MFFCEFDLRDKRCVVVGCGNTAKRRIRQLIKENADITIIDPEILQNSFENSKNIKIIRDFYKKDYILGADFVFAQTNDKNLNETVCRDCSNLKILHASTTKTVQSNAYKFSVPAQKNCDDIFLCVSTSGKFPGLSRKILDDINIKKWLPLFNILKDFRNEALLIFKDETARRKYLNEISSANMAKYFFENGSDAFILLIKKIREKFKKSLN